MHETNTVDTAWNCPSCGRRAMGEPYDVGSGPEFSCPSCEWCWGAVGQALDPNEALKVPASLYVQLPDWAKRSLVCVPDEPGCGAR